MKKVLIEREKSDARIDSSEREEARPKVKILFLHGFFASGQCQPALALREAFEGRAEVISPDLPTMTFSAPAEPCLQPSSNMSPSALSAA